MTDALKILIIEDDPDVALGCEQALQLDGFPAEVAASAELARRQLGADFPGIVISDIRLPGQDGLSLQRDLHALDPELPVVLITGHGDVSMAVQAMKDGAYDFLQKPFAPEQLVDIARRALEKRRLVLEVRTLRQQLADTVAGRSTIGGLAEAFRLYLNDQKAHIKSEERDIYPLASEVLTPADWAEIDAAFLDNDEAGRKATAELKAACRNLSDQSVHYRPHNDLNDYLRSCRPVKEHRRSCGRKL